MLRPPTLLGEILETIQLFNECFICFTVHDISSVQVKDTGCVGNPPSSPHPLWHKSTHFLSALLLSFKDTRNLFGNPDSSQPFKCIFRGKNMHKCHLGLNYFHCTYFGVSNALMQSALTTATASLSNFPPYFHLGYSLSLLKISVIVRDVLSLIKYSFAI